ncbi:hypothetical protein RUND412_010634 [Rhizina undulata]
MASFFTPSTSRTGAIPNLKFTPSNSPGFFSRPGTRSSSKQRQLSNGSVSSNFSDCGLALKRVIGCSTTAFDSHPPSRSFAYTAGAAAVVVQLDDDLQITQRFFRARPNAPTLATVAPYSYAPSTPTHHSQETRNKTAASLREAGIGYAPQSSAYINDDSPSSRTWTARERIKAATCVSFSPDGKWLAVGETGYNPRILIFSMSRDVPGDVPVAAMSEHTFGVRDVAFSPCSKYLASIGTMNDGFVYIWALSSHKNGMIRLHSSNKCTSYVRQIAWMGKSLVTVGTRHVKIWKTDDDVGEDRTFARKLKLTFKQQKPVSPGPKVLHGRNALLGSMSDCVMSCVVGISEDKALVCSERGDICLLDESGLRFTKVATADFGVNCVTVDADLQFAWVAGKHGNIRALVLKEIMPSTPPQSPSSSRSNSPVLPFSCRPANVMAISSMLGHIFTLDSNCSLKIINISSLDGVPVPNELIRELPAHKDACLGVRVLPPNHPSRGVFFTWSAGGCVLFWNLEGESKGHFLVRLEQPDCEDDVSNELKVVRVSKDGDFFVSGDKFGVLRVIDATTWKCQFTVKAHGAEIMDIAIQRDTIASCSRDRTVQVFHKNEDGNDWSLAQTLDDHTASVSRVMLLENGNKLLSCSTDRTIVVRELCRREALDGTITTAYLPIRTLTTKASPVHMTPVSENSPWLMVSTMDRQIQKFDMTTGKSVQCFKATDETGEAVVMDAITLSKEKGNRPRILAGISTTDKSIRLYDTGGGLIDKEWGHTEGVSDVALLETDADGEDTEQTILISTGTDGTIMIWGFTLKSNENDSKSSDSDNNLSSKELTASKTPLRRVLSRSELLDFSPKPGSTPTTTETSTVSTPTSSAVSGSPPRVLRRKTSSYGMNRNLSSKSTLGMQSTASTTSEESVSPSTPVFSTATSVSSGRESRKSARDRTPSPPNGTPKVSPVPPSSRKASRSSRTRKKSLETNTVATITIKENTANTNTDIGHVNGLAESLTRSLRSFRKKIDSVGPGEGVRPDLLKDLQRELGLTARELGAGSDGRGRRTPLPKSMIEGLALETGDAMAQLLDEYSERLVSLVNERLDEGRGKSVETTGEG